MIQQLDRVVAAQIVAGEVIERPASVVRELIENAIDAGATQIQIDYWAAGLRAIRVRDNGCGMVGDQIERAFARHTTSKLVQVEDLWSITTLGFRGEALPSIAAISQVTCISRVAGAEYGYELRIAGGDVQGYRVVSAPVGTCVWVRQLFYNTPQRRAFLRSAAGEAAAIAAVVGQYAMAYPEIAVTLSAEERCIMQTYGDGEVRSVVATIEGVDLVHQLVPVVMQAGEEATIAGWISGPSISRHTRAGIHLFVNRRVIQPRGGLLAVIDEAYRGLLPTGRFPFVVLNITLPVYEVDINAHPTKSEVKFRDPARILSLLSRALRNGLLACALEPPAAGAAMPVPNQVSSSDVEPRMLRPKVDSQLQLRLLGIGAPGLLVAATSDGLILIDSQAVSARLWYERLLTQWPYPGQPLARPVLIVCDSQQQQQLLDLALQLAEWGIHIEDFGHALRLRTWPIGLPSACAGELLHAIANASERWVGLTESRSRGAFAAELAEQAAMRAVIAPNEAEAEELIAALLHCQDPYRSPHGRPTMIMIGQVEIARRFGHAPADAPKLRR
ncbi:MAG: hypothetical protein Fur005_05790 [Roseiflexaceae bacterium]